VAPEICPELDCLSGDQRLSSGGFLNSLNRDVKKLGHFSSRVTGAHVIVGLTVLLVIVKVSKLLPLNRRKHHNLVKVWATLFTGGGFVNLSRVIQEHSLLEAFHRLEIWEPTIVSKIQPFTR
jgi:hypothetical protein